ncbi:MAG: hypothetical protein WAL95_21140 [Candidatus Acidiferrales bacterium]
MFLKRLSLLRPASAHAFTVNFPSALQPLVGDLATYRVFFRYAAHLLVGHGRLRIAPSTFSTKTNGNIDPRVAVIRYR